MSAIARVARLKRRPMSVEESSRQLRRATLGVQYSHIASAAGQRFDQWVDAQLNLPVTPGEAYTTIVTRRYPGFPDGPPLNGGWPAHNSYLNWKFQQPEKLRVRLTYAMLELFSVGGFNTSFEGVGHHGVHWDNIESEVTQGTFRSLIEKITRSQPMSRWLTYWRNAKTDGVRQPDENYGREIMQLYTIGLWELHLDGTRVKTGELDPSDPRYVLNGQSDVPTYGQSDVANMARVFTGLTSMTTYDDGATADSLNDSFIWGANIGTEPQIDSQGRRGWAATLEYAPSYHESTLEKVALQGRLNVPAGTNGDVSLAAALDALVDHPSCAPYLAGRLIRLLITSNPTPEYVARVASVFRDDGTGQVGNLRAFFRAILLDQEALAPIEKQLTLRVPSYEEQALALLLSQAPAFTPEGCPTAIAFGTFPGEYPAPGAEAEPSLIGMDWHGPMQTFCNPSVFGRWPAAYSAAGDVFNQGLLSPELATLTEGNVTDLIDRSSGLYERIGNTALEQDRIDCMTTGNRAAVIDRIEFLITGGSAPQTFKDELLTWLNTERGDYWDTPEGSADTYRSIVAAFWLSPWGISRR